MAPNSQQYDGTQQYDGPQVMALGPSVEEFQQTMDLKENAVLCKARSGLKQQLLDRKQDLEERLREKAFALKGANKKREDAGIKLYGLQKTLGNLQLSLKTANERLAIANMEHIKADEELAKTQKQHDTKRSELQSLKQKMEKSTQAYNELGGTLQEVQNHNEKLKSEIAIARRTTYTTEELIVKSEKEKKVQDYLIADLQNQIKHQVEKQELSKAKLIAQERETKLARAALTEVGIEMESINTEKKQITNQWKSSLIVLSRCNEALQAFSDAINSQKEQEISIQGERHSIKKSIKKEQEKVEQEVASLTSLDNRLKLLQKQIEKIVNKRLKFQEKSKRLKKSLEEVEAKQEKASGEIDTIQKEIKVVEKDCLKQTQLLHALEDEMIKGLSEKATLERSHQKLVQRTLEIRRLVRKEEMAITELEFELAQIRNDVFKVESYNQNVRGVLSSLDLEIQQKFSFITKVEAEIRRRHNELGMKMKEIDRLNKQYDKLTANFVDKDASLWDNIISKLANEISDKAKASNQLQKSWVLMQTELISISIENNALAEKVQRLGTEKVALVQRNERLEAEFTFLGRNIKELDNSMQIKHNIIIRLNDLISKNATLHDFLESENLNMHTSSAISLKEKEQEIIKMEITLRDSRKEKDELSVQVAQLEYHIKLWSSKIAFEKQTQETLVQFMLSPAAMTTHMKKELERLKLKLDNSMRVRERLLSILETRVANRKAISVKVQAINQKKGSNGKNNERMQKLKDLAELRRQIRVTQQTTTSVERGIQDLLEKKLSINGQVSVMDQQISEMITHQEELRSKLREHIKNKSLQLLATALRQRMVKRHHDINESKWKVQIKLSLDNEVNESHRKCVALSQVVRGLLKDFPLFEVTLDIMTIRLELSIKLVTPT